MDDTVNWLDQMGWLPSMFQKEIIVRKPGPEPTDQPACAKSQPNWSLLQIILPKTSIQLSSHLIAFPTSSNLTSRLSNWPLLLFATVMLFTSASTTAWSLALLSCQPNPPTFLLNHLITYLTQKYK